MTTRKAMCAALALTVSLPAAAAEFRAAYGDWSFDISGTATESGRTYDFQKDLAARRAGKHSLQVEWDTGPGWWRPDLAFSDSRIGATGTHTESSSPALPVPPTTVTLSVNSDFRDTDLVLRYPLDSAALKLSAGVAVKRLHGTVVITDSTQGQPGHGNYDQVFPELHLQARWLPLDWLAFEATGQGVQYRDNRAFEVRGGIELRPFDPLLLEATWQEKRYDIKTSAEALDATLSGVMIRAGFLVR